ncbi:MAG: hypothetical protein MZU84_08885 [Sphingobacterium sp.]|nr:hypothetical protein [Sphingobacterium sp.]
MDGHDAGRDRVAAPAPRTAGNDVQEREGIEAQPVLVETDGVGGGLQADGGGPWRPCP